MFWYFVMQINSIRFILFIIGIAIIQQIVNNSTTIYIDCVGLVLVALLITNTECYFRFLIILSIFADLIGHWYFGTHLLAVILISFISNYIVDFYKICNNLQKNHHMRNILRYITSNNWINWHHST